MLPLALLRAPAACQRDGSVNDPQVHHGPDVPAAPPSDQVAQAKVVQARVNGRLATNAQPFASTDAIGQFSARRCYAPDANNAQVGLIGPDGFATNVLPAVLDGAATSVDVQVQAATTVTPGPSGCDLHFALARPSVPTAVDLAGAQKAVLPHASRTVASTNAQLEAVCGSVLANTPPGNPVSLFIAGSLAYASWRRPARFPTPRPSSPPTPI